MEERGPGHAREYTCRVRLPLLGASGEEVSVEAMVQGKKRDAMAACALRACQLLDRRGVLRQRGPALVHGSRKRSGADSDEDDDGFYDRTGQVEQKRQRRLDVHRSAETHQSLLAKASALNDQLARLRADMNPADPSSAIGSEGGKDEDDALDAFMSSMASHEEERRIARLRREEADLLRELAATERLVAAAAPALAAIKPTITVIATDVQLEDRGRQLGSEGSRGPPLAVASLAPDLPPAGSPKEPEQQPSLIVPPTTANAKAPGPVAMTAASPAHQVVLPKAPSRPPVHPSLQAALLDDGAVGLIKAPKRRAELEADHSSDFAIPAAKKSVSCRSRCWQARGEGGGEGGSSPCRYLTSLCSFDLHYLYMCATAIDAHSNILHVPQAKGGSSGRGVLAPAQWATSDADDMDTTTTWVPPTGQTGDGRTSLNEKLGY